MKKKIKEMKAKIDSDRKTVIARRPQWPEKVLSILNTEGNDPILQVRDRNGELLADDPDLPVTAMVAMERMTLFWIRQKINFDFEAYPHSPEEALAKFIAHAVILAQSEALHETDVMTHKYWFVADWEKRGD